MLNLDDLCSRLLNAEYRDDKFKCDFNIIPQRHEYTIREIVKTWGAEQTMEIENAKRIGDLEAKVYAYEQIIAKSNFKPMLDNNKKASIGRVDQDI